MALTLRSNDKVFLVGYQKHQITGAKLPSNRQVLAVLFFNIRQVKLNVSESANLVIRECIIFWEKARIPTKSLPNCVKKLLNLYQVWKQLQKNANKKGKIFKEREEEFKQKLENLFDIAHADAFKIMKIEEDKIFLKQQREQGRKGCMVGVDKALAEKENRKREREISEEKKRLKQMASLATSTTSSLELFDQEESDSSSTSDENNSDFILASSKSPEAATKRGRKDIITPKLVAALDRCQLSVRDSVYILEATVEALGLSADNFPINKSSIQRIRTKARKIRAEAIKIDFQNNSPEVVTVHWDGKLLPALNQIKCTEERLPIIITFGNKEQILAVPKLKNSSGTEQAEAVSKALTDWDLRDKVQIMCCDTTASNTGPFNGACILLEQKLERELILFACRHHVYELVLKTIFETKMHQVTSGPSIAFFKNFKDNWKNINQSNFQTNTAMVKKYFTETEIEELLQFFSAELRNVIVRGDYRELVELSLIFLGGDDGRKRKIRPPGALHHARWMAKANYSLKMYLLRSQLNISNRDKQALEDVCLFIVTSYVKPWLRCNLAVKAPYQDLCFLRTLKQYERIDKTISNAALKKFSQHLWYLSEEIVILSLFDDEVDIKTKIDMVANLNIDSSNKFNKRYVPTEEDLRSSLYGKLLLVINIFL